MQCSWAVGGRKSCAYILCVAFVEVMERMPADAFDESNVVFGLFFRRVSC